MWSKTEMESQPTVERTRPGVSRMRLARNFVLLGSAEIFSKAVTILAFAYLARVFGPAEFGTLEFALAVVTILTLLVDWGLSPYGAREVGKDSGRTGALVRHIVVTRLALVLLAWAVLVGLSLALDQPWSTRRVLLLYGLPLVALAGSLSWVFQGRDAMEVVAGGSMLRWSMFAGGCALVASGPGDTWKIPLVEAVAVGGMAVLYVSIFRSRFGGWGSGVSSARVATLLREAFPIGASELTWALRVYFATVALGVLVGGPEVGWFGGAHRIVLALHTFVWLYFFNVLPSMARTSRRPRAELRALIGDSLRASAWAVVFVAIVVTVMAKPIVTVLYGSAYEASAPVLRILVWLVPVAAMSGHYRYVLIGYGHQDLEFLAAAGGAAVAAILGLLTVRPFGMLGVAGALVASEVAIWALAYAFVRREVTSIPAAKVLWKPAAGGAGLAAALVLWPPHSGWLIAVLAAAAYWSCAALVEPQLRADIRALLTTGRASTRPSIV
jgi:PST family polysaccharide transporter